MTEHLTAKELSARWKRSTAWITGEAKAKRIPGAFKVGHFWRFPLEAIERFEMRRAVADPLSMTEQSAARQAKKAS